MSISLSDYINLTGYPRQTIRDRLKKLQEENKEIELTEKKNRVIYITDKGLNLLQENIKVKPILKRNNLEPLNENKGINELDLSFFLTELDLLKNEIKEFKEYNQFLQDQLKESNKIIKDLNKTIRKQVKSFNKNNEILKELQTQTHYIISQEKGLLSQNTRDKASKQEEVFKEASNSGINKDPENNIDEAEIIIDENNKEAEHEEIFKNASRYRTDTTRKVFNSSEKEAGYKRKPYYLDNKAKRGVFTEYFKTKPNFDPDDLENNISFIDEIFKEIEQDNTSNNQDLNTINKDKEALDNQDLNSKEEAPEKKKSLLYRSMIALKFMFTKQ